MKLYLAAALICTVSLLATGCRRPLDDISAPLNNLTMEAQIAPVIPALAAVDVGSGPQWTWEAGRNGCGHRAGTVGWKACDFGEALKVRCAGRRYMEFVAAERGGLR